MTSEKPIHTIVLDAGPIIRGEPGVSTLLQQCEQIVSTPAVIAEIRDEATRSRLSTTLLPFLVQRNPKPNSVKTITDFARKTGDLAVLSRVDLQLLALSYELECERNGGDWRLRQAPGQKRTNGPPPTKPEMTKEQTADASGGEEEVTVETIKQESSEELPLSIKVLEPAVNLESTTSSSSTESRNLENYITSSSIPSLTTVEPSEKEPATELETVAPSSPAAQPEDEQPAQSQAEPNREEQQTQPDNIEEIIQRLEDAQVHGASEENDITEGSDSEGWITPSNLKKQQEKDAASGVASGPEPKSMQVVRQFESCSSLESNIVAGYDHG
jgi:RNA-binding protein NOB1